MKGVIVLAKVIDSNVILSRDDRIVKEKRKLRNNYKEIGKEHLKRCDYLFAELAEAVITMEECKADIKKGSKVVETTNGSQQFKKANPLYDIYNKAYKNYCDGLKMLNGLLPKEPKITKKEKEKQQKEASKTTNPLDFFNSDEYDKI